MRGERRLEHVVRAVVGAERGDDERDDGEGRMSTEAAERGEVGGRECAAEEVEGAHAPAGGWGNRKQSEATGGS